jgi:uncharacterized membrane protein
LFVCLFVYLLDGWMVGELVGWLLVVVGWLVGWLLVVVGGGWWLVVVSGWCMLHPGASAREEDGDENQTYT